MYIMRYSCTYVCTWLCSWLLWTVCVWLRAHHLMMQADFLCESFRRQGYPWWESMAFDFTVDFCEIVFLRPSGQVQCFMSGVCSEFVHSPLYWGHLVMQVYLYNLSIEDTLGCGCTVLCGTISPLRTPWDAGVLSCVAQPLHWGHLGMWVYCPVWHNLSIEDTLGCGCTSTMSLLLQLELDWYVLWRVN
jgi:hypothetical protein